MLAKKPNETIGQCRSYDLIQVPLQFSTGVSSSGGIICVKSRLFFDIIIYLMCFGFWMTQFFVKIALQGG